MSYRYVIGVDPGTNTGIGIRNTQTNKLEDVASMSIHKALMLFINGRFSTIKEQIFVYVEDARKNPQNAYFAGKQNRIGLGSIQRDAKIWEDFLEDMNIAFKMVKPNSKFTKLTAKQFSSFTGYEGRTNEHSRDAGMIALYNPVNLQSVKP